MRAHKVTSGETLATIAARAYGDPAMWPSLYRYNNMLAVQRRRGGKPIVNPNQLRPGETIFVPELRRRSARRSIAQRMRSRPGSVQRSTAVTNRSASQSSSNQVPVRPSSPFPQPSRPSAPPEVRLFPPASGGSSGTGQGDNPAERTLLTGLAWTFELPKTKVMSYDDPLFSAEFFFEGAVQLQHDKVDTALKLLTTGAEADVQEQAKKVFGQLFSSAYIKANLAQRTVEFECTLTMVAAMHMPAAQLSAAVDEVGRPVLRGTVQWPDLEGEFMGFIFATDRVRVGIDIRPKSQDEQKPPTSMPAMAGNSTGQPSRPAPVHLSHSDQDSQVTVTFFGALVLLGVIIIAAFSN